MSMSLVHMGSGGSQEGGEFGVNILVLTIDLLFIVNSIIGASVIIGWVLGRENIYYSGSKTSMLVGEGLIHRE